MTKDQGPAALPQQRLKGIALVSGAVLCFAFLDTIAKFLTGELPVLEVLWGRYALAMGLAFVLAKPGHRLAVVRTSRPWLQFARSLLIFGASISAITALRYIPLDQFVAILFGSPFIITALAGPVLGERIGPRRWAAICVGFFGVLLVVRPGFGGIHWAASFAVGGTLCYSLYSLLTRLAAHSDSDETSLFYANVLGAVVTSAAMPFMWVTPEQSWKLVLLVTTGVLGGIGHMMMIVAFRHAPASVLSPFTYSQILWTTLLGFIVFGSVPDGWTIAGASVVVASGLYLLYQERRP